MATAISKIYDTVLSIPGMNDSIKLDLRLSRKQIFFLSKIVERGLARHPEKDLPAILEHMPEGISQELNQVAEELLNKAGLKEMNEKLNGL